MSYVLFICITKLVAKHYINSIDNVNSLMYSYIMWQTANEHPVL